MTRTGILATLLDLILPGGCAGCGAAVARDGVCGKCAAVLAEPPELRRPHPAPPGLPACVAGGGYDGAIRELILEFKERGRRALSRPLGDRLAAVVAAGWPSPGGPLALVPIPATAAAIRARHGDHMLLLARRAARVLAASGRSVVVTSPLRALPKPDSAHLDRDQRAVVARSAFALRWRSPVRLAALASVADTGAVVLVDDILTTGATLAAAAGLLARAGVPVAFAATIAATRRHS